MQFCKINYFRHISVYQSETGAEEGDLLPQASTRSELKNWWRESRHQFTNPSQIKSARLRLTRHKLESMKNFFSNFFFFKGTVSNIPDMKVNSKT